MRLPITGWCLMTLALAAACGDVPEDPTPEAPRTALLGAQYYTWYDHANNHWLTGHYKEPLLGQYDSFQPAVAQQHITWAADAGIDIFAVEWLGPDFAEDNLRRGLLRASNLDRIRFCLFYDTTIRLRQFGYDNPFRFDFDDARLRQIVLDDLLHLAREFFDHPRYYRIDGRPVLWLYLTRSFAGAWEEMLAEFRARTLEMGVPVYVIADEVWYSNFAPSRVQAFDAVSTYSIYDPIAMRSKTRWSLAEFTELILPIYVSWQSLSIGVRNSTHDRPVPFMPAVSPQFDDRALRGSLNSPVVAESREQVAALFRQARDLALLNDDPEERVVWITSFNEWHEGTSIEPTERGGPPFPEGNYHFELLDVTREIFESPQATTGHPGGS